MRHCVRCGTISSETDAKPPCDKCGGDLCEACCDLNPELTDAEVSKALANAGIDMRPVHERMHKMVAKYRAQQN